MLSCPDSLSQILFHCVGCMTSVLHCLHASRIPSLDLYPDNPLQIGSWISNLLVFLDLGNICCHNSRGTGSMRAQVVGIGEVELHLYVAAQDHDSHVKLQFQPPSNSCSHFTGTREVIRCSGKFVESKFRTTMWGRRLVQLEKRFVPVLSNTFALSRQCSSTPDVREFMGKGLMAIAEIERLSPYTDFNDIRLKPLLKTAKESFELSLEIEKDNAVVMLWLARLHLYHNIPGACLRSGANLLETAADAGLADAQYELACRIRSEAALLGDEDPMDDRIFKYLESAACQKHAGALFLVGAIYLSGRHVRRDPQAAAWCFRKAAEQGYIPASTVYASLVSKGADWEELDTTDNDDGDQTSEQSMKLGEGSAQNGSEQPLELSEAARFHFDKAAEAGDPLALEWLTRVPDAKEEHQLT